MHRLRIASLFGLLVACDNAPGGLGIGRPAFTPPATSPVTPIAITMVYASTATPADGFVQLENQSGATLDFNTTKLTLVSDAGTIDIGKAAGAAIGNQWAAGARISVAAHPALQLHPSAGELAVISQAGIIQGSVTWGIYTPSTGSSSDFATTSSGSGAPFSAGSSDLPFPLTPGAAINFDPNVKVGNTPNACVVANSSANPATGTACTQGPSTLAITRVLPGGLDPNGSGGYIEVRNLDAQNAVDLYGLQICTPTCTQLFYSSDNPNKLAGVLDPAGSVAAGATDTSRGVINTAHGGENLDGVMGSDVTPAPPQGEVFLLRALAPTPNYAPSDMLAYVGYAQNANLQQNPDMLTNNSNAVAANVWSNGAVITPPKVRGEALTLTDATGASRTAWAPTVGAAQTTPNGGWSSCSYPQTQAPATLIFGQVANTTPPRIMLVNNTGSAIDLTQLRLSVGSGQDIPLGSAKGPNIDQSALAANQSLWVELQSGGTCTALNNVCQPNFVAGLSAQEATVLNASDQVVAHVQWQGPVTTSAYGQAAATVGLWPSENCRTVAIPQNLALKVQQGQPGQGSGDFTIGYPTFP